MRRSDRARRRAMASAAVLPRSFVCLRARAARTSPGASDVIVILRTDSGEANTRTGDEPGEVRCSPWSRRARGAHSRGTASYRDRHRALSVPRRHAAPAPSGAIGPQPAAGGAVRHAGAPAGLIVVNNAEEARGPLEGATPCLPRRCAPGAAPTRRPPLAIAPRPRAGASTAPRRRARAYAGRQARRRPAGRPGASPRPRAPPARARYRSQAASALRRTHAPCLRTPADRSIRLRNMRDLAPSGRTARRAPGRRAPRAPHRTGRAARARGRPRRAVDTVTSPAHRRN